MNNKSKEDKFAILGHEFSRKHYPVLYRSAQKDLEWLAERLKGLADAVYEGDVASAAQALESDLEHSG